MRRPVMRAGEVLETVPGVVISQHSGEGKANQYYLRGFNLDHGTDFATTVAGMPVNMPTHGHGHGYSDLNFLIPELVSGVQYSKGPYFAEHGDFATAGAANINYTNSLARPIVRVGGGGQGFMRALAAGSLAVGGGTLLGAPRGAAQRRSVDPARRLPQGQRRGPLHAWRRVERPVGDRHGLRRPVELDRPDPGARRRGGDDRPLRHHRHLGRRRLLPLQRLGRLAAHREQRQHQGERLRHRLRHEPVLELHLLPGRRRERRPVPPGRPALRVGRQGQPPAARATGAAARCRTPSRSRFATTTSRTSACITPCGASRSTPCGKTPCCRPAWPPTRRTTRRGRRGCGRWPGVRVDGYRFDVEAGEPANSRHRLRRAGQPEVRRRVRSVRRHRVLRQRRARLPQQRRPRRDHHRRSRHRRCGRSRDAAGPRTRGRGRVPQRPHPAAADQRGAVDAQPRFRAHLHRRRRQHRGRPPEPSLRRRVVQLLLAAAVAHPRRRRRACRARTSPTTTRRATTCPAP